MAFRWFWPIFLFTAAFFLSSSLVLLWAGSGQLFISPDETANAFFARRFAESGVLSVSVPLNLTLHDSFFARSTFSRAGLLLPVGFIGLPVLYGLFVFLLGGWILPFLTPVCVVLAALALRRPLARIFSQHIADLSAVLFLITPAVWYYSARGLMPNVLFVCLLVFTAALFVRRPVLSGIFLGLALFVRLSEGLWIIPSMVLLFVFYRTHLTRSLLLRFCVGFVVGLLPIFVFHTLTYGHPFATGYTFMSVEISSVPAESIEKSSLVFPFGIDVKVAARHVLQYGVMLFWWLTPLTLIGLFIERKKIAYAVLFLFVSLWLGIWYGSWTLFDNPDPTQVTIANSYVRYWLPVFVLTLPYISSALIALTKWMRPWRTQNVFIILLVLMVFGLNMHTVFFRGQDGLIRVAETLIASKKIRDDVFVRAPSDAVFIVDRADKLFFPDRLVRYPLRAEETYALLPRIAAHAPLYYYGITLPEKDLTHLNTVRLKPLGLQIEWIKTYQEESLYRLYFP